MAKKVTIFLLFLLLFLPIISAAEFDNGISDYDEEEEIITFSNGCLFGFCAGDIIGQVQLKTPKNFKVGAGYNYVWEMDAWVYEDYNEFLKQFEYLDMKTKNKVNRDLDIKILSYQEIEVDDYYEECYINYSNSTVGVETCRYVINGTHIEEREVWEKVTPADIKKADGKVTLRGYTDVQIGDYIDWSPVVFGVRISHDIWAEWTQDLNAGLIAYYKQDEQDTTGSGAIEDSVGSNDATNNGSSNTTGKIKNGYEFDSSNDDYIRTDSAIQSLGNFTISLWFNSSTFSSEKYIYSAGYNNANSFLFFANSVGNYNYIFLGTGVDDIAPVSSTNIWHNLIMTRSGTTLKTYIDNSEIDSSTVSDTAIASFRHEWGWSVTRAKAGAGFDGVIDEVGIWNRSLNTTEINQLWNSGDGLPYTDDVDIPPQITLISPSNASNLTSSSQEFISTVTDDKYVQNVSLLIDEVIVSTNISHINGTYLFTETISDGYHNWSILAYDNNSEFNQSEYRFFNFSMPPIYINLQSPSDVSIHQTPSVNMSCYAYKDEGVIQLNLTVFGETQLTITNSTPGENLTISQIINFSEGNYTWGCSALNLDTSATSSNRTFEVSYSSPEINLFSPENDFQSLIEDVTFIFNASDINGVENVSLFLNGILNETNSSGVQGNYSFSKTFEDGYYNWSIVAFSIYGESTTSDTRSFTVHTTGPNITITEPLVFSDYIIVGENETLTYDISEAGENNSHFDECWYTYGDNLLDSFETDKDNWVFEGGYASSQNRTTDWSSEGNWSALIDKKDTMNISKIINHTIITFDYSELSGESDLQVLDDGVSVYVGDGTEYNITLSIDYGSIITFKVINGISVPSYAIDNIRYTNYLNCSGNTTKFEYIGVNNMTVFAKDIYGITTNLTHSWNYLLSALTINYDTSIYEGSQNTITMTFDILDPFTVSQATLDYDGDIYSSNILYSTGEYTITATPNAPIVNADENITFNFNIVINGTTYNPREYNQTILNADLGVCGGISNDTILNISLVDEELQTTLRGDLQIGGEIKSLSSGETVATIYTNFSNVSSSAICFSPPLSYDSYYMDAEIRYDSTGHSAELYHIQNADITDGLGNLTLYDLNDNDTTTFDVVYQDDSFNFVEGAIIQLQRKYINEGAYKTVEAPLTSNEGVVVLHIDLDSIKYRATVVKDGVVLDEFDNLVFECESELTGECSQKLLGTIDSQNEENLDTVRDFSYSEPVMVNNTITLSFTVPSSSSSSINVVLEQRDQFDNRSICNTTVITSAGSISCDFEETIGDSYLTLYVYKDGETIAIKSYIVHPSNYLDWLGNNYIFIFVLLLSLVGMALTSPEWIIINGIITMVIAGGLYLASGLNFVVGLGSIAWLLFAAIILIAKISKQEDR